MPDAVKKVGLSLSTANSVLAAADNEQTISGYSLLQDIYDQPALILKVDMPRKISEMGAMTAGYFLIALLAFAVLYAVLLNFALSRLVITRIERMGKFVNYVSLSGDLTTSLAVESKDEISQLQSNINRMIGKLRDSQEALSKDIQERERMRQRLVEMATHDYLTGLPNRLLLSDRFIVAAAQTHRNKASLAILSLDLDRFKAVNDTLGHDAGDHVLRAVSTRLSGITRASDTLARVGGDEFILLTQNAEDMKDINVIAQKILDSFAEPLIVDNAEVDLSTSIGIALYPQDGEDLDTLIKKSDASLYYAKGHGRNQFKFFADGDVRVGRVFRSTA